jgi:beta-phosphoglucomutase-like phosphatase (HAD superfamily)
MKKIIYTKEELLQEYSVVGQEFVKVQNPDYIHPAYEFYPLAEKNVSLTKHLNAVLMDMDGTTTTTEVLCIHSLEYMVRKLSARMDKKIWAGFDHDTDYPHIIGNSTTKHVEYLCQKYGSSFIPAKAVKAFIYAALWTLLLGNDKQRKNDVMNNIVNLGLQDMIHDTLLKELNKNTPEYGIREITDKLYEKYGTGISALQFSDYVRLAIDVYYQRYHFILERIKTGESTLVSRELFNDPNKHLIEPMPGIEIFLPLVKGWLGRGVEHVYNTLVEGYEVKSGSAYYSADRDGDIDRLKKLASMYETAPAKVAIVTSSIYYEADIVVAEVFKVLCEKISKLELPESQIRFLLSKFNRYQNYYDGFVTASDSSEIRLKPHRDLYSIALHQLGVKTENFSDVVGFEDSESGTIAIRAAGIGRCVAVPFAQTSGHNFAAASHICKGGLPEVLLLNSLFTAL